MLKNYLTIALRNLVRYKTYTAINALGLATGIAFCLLTFLYVRHEWTYDQFHEKSDRIFRLGACLAECLAEETMPCVSDYRIKLGHSCEKTSRNSPMLCGFMKVRELCRSAIIPLK